MAPGRTKPSTSSNTAPVRSSLRRRIIVQEGSDSSEEETNEVVREPRKPPSQSRRQTQQSDSSSSEDKTNEAVFRQPRSRKPPGPSKRGRFEDEENDEGQTQSQSRRKNQSTQQQEDFAGLFDQARVLSHDELLKNALVYFMMTQNKLLPIRKSELVKNALNKQSKDFKDVVYKAEKVLNKIFGLRLVGMKAGPDDTTVNSKVVEASSFMVVSKFRQFVSKLAVPKHPDSFNQELRRAVLILILSCTYMLSKDLDEDTIWQILEQMNLAGQLCRKREDLRRILKTEFVDTLYLTRQDVKDTDQVVSRYNWGYRAEQEFSKYAILKFVAQMMGDKMPSDFPVHFSKFKDEDIEQIDGEDARTEQQGEDTDSDNNYGRAASSRRLRLESGNSNSSSGDDESGHEEVGEILDV